MAKFVKKYESQFTILPNELANNSRLSWKAKGILFYMLSKKDGWQYYETEIRKHATDGKDSLNAGIKELIDAGYLQRTQERDETGRFTSYYYEVYDTPQITASGFSGSGKSTTINTNRNEVFQQTSDSQLRQDVERAGLTWTEIH